MLFVTIDPNLLRVIQIVINTHSNISNNNTSSASSTLSDESSVTIGPKYDQDHESFIAIYLMKIEIIVKLS